MVGYLLPAVFREFALINTAYFLRLKKGGDGNNAVPSKLGFKLKRL
jgi:hypothetical protein